DQGHGRPRPRPAQGRRGGCAASRRDRGGAPARPPGGLRVKGDAAVSQRRIDALASPRASVHVSAAFPSTIPLILAICVLGGLGLLIGLVTGVIVAATRVAPFILTLGGLSILASISLILSGQQPIQTGLVLSSLDVNTWLGIPLPAWCFAGTLVLGALILRYT